MEQVKSFILINNKYLIVTNNQIINQQVWDSIIDQYNYFFEENNNFLIIGTYFINLSVLLLQVMTALTTKQINQSFLILATFFNTQQVYIKARNKRLAKKIITANFGDWTSNFVGDFFTIDNGSATNFSSYMYHAPLGLLFPDFQNNYINRKNKIFGPTIDRTWKFIEPNDHPEWLMRDTR